MRKSGIKTRPEFDGSRFRLRIPDREQGLPGAVTYVEEKSSVSSSPKARRLRLQARTHDVEQLRCLRVGGLRSPISSESGHLADAVADEFQRLVELEPSVGNPVPWDVLRQRTHPTVRCHP